VTDLMMEGADSAETKVEEIKRETTIRRMKTK
jgi:hypothetical protein